MSDFPTDHPHINERAPRFGIWTLLPRLNATLHFMLPPFHFISHQSLPTCTFHFLAATILLLMRLLSISCATLLQKFRPPPAPLFMNVPHCPQGPSWSSLSVPSKESNERFDKAVRKCKMKFSLPHPSVRRRGAQVVASKQTSRARARFIPSPAPRLKPPAFAHCPPCCRRFHAFSAAAAASAAAVVVVVLPLRCCRCRQVLRRSGCGSVRVAHRHQRSVIRHR